MNKLHEVIQIRHAAKRVNTSLHVPKQESFAIIHAIVAYEQMRGGFAWSWEIQEGIALGYLRTNQLLNEMVAKHLLQRTLDGGSYKYKITGIPYIRYAID